MPKRRNPGGNPYGAEHKRRRAEAIASLRPGTPCPLCKRPMYAWMRLHLDHVIPVAQGGAHGPVRLVCGSCNESRGAVLGNKSRKRKPPGWVSKPKKPESNLPKW